MQERNKQTKKKGKVVDAKFKLVRVTSDVHRVLKMQAADKDKSIGNHIGELVKIDRK